MKILALIRIMIDISVAMFSLGMGVKDVGVDEAIDLMIRAIKEDRTVQVISIITIISDIASIILLIR